MLIIFSQATQATTEFYFEFGLSNPTHNCLVILSQATQATIKFESGLAWLT